MNVKPLKGLLAILVGAAVLAPSAFALSDAEGHFVVGYQAYLEKKFDVCAGQLLLADPLPEELHIRQQIYLAACQTELGYRADAAAKVAALDSDKVAKTDKDTYQQLKKKLKSDIDSLNKIYVTLMPYGGSIDYSGGTKKSASFFGAFASLDYLTWSLHLGFESDEIKLISPLTPYTQTQVHGDISKWLTPSLQLRFGYTTINASDTTLSGIQVIHAGGQYYFTPNAQLILRADSSNYPNSTLKSLSLTEGTVGFGYRFTAGANHSLWAHILSQTVIADASNMNDKTTSFTLKSSYERIAGDIALTLYSFDFGVGYWGGNEAFGVRDDGFVVYNSLEEHTAGWNVSGTYHFNLAWSAKLAASQETYHINGPDYQATVLSAGVAVTF